ncbi:unnamed protein product [Diatraea saccharalis]|uniref:Uncharacterized protein n=1 Tax=Diatraea saccharalis TaxID=40085 RepID=A0A9N9WGI4_9NEOP|nr:unnamed protein product [Diatraea saccharalis]
MIYGQPSACNDDVECSSGFYCEKVVHACHECLRCEELKRESPVPQEICVKSVVECGACIKGYVEGLRLDRACILLSERSDGGGSVPPYGWLFIALPLLGFMAIVIYVVWKRKTLFSYLEDVFKIRASTLASVHSRGTNNGTVSAPNAHDPPPPYNPYYEPVRPVSPSDTNEIIVSEDSAIPFIKRTPAAPTQRGRDSAGSQAARPFNNPAYVRGPSAGIGQAEDSDPGSPFPPHDEDTMESHWTPNQSINNNISDNTTDGGVSPSGGDVAGAIATRAPAAVARRPAAGTEPPSKVARLREDTNNNRGHESSGGSGSGSPRASSPSPSPSPGPPHSVIINVVTNINKVEQRNTLNN